MKNKKKKLAGLLSSAAAVLADLSSKVVLFLIIRLNSLFPLVKAARAA